jgi:hypothetical protein
METAQMARAAEGVRRLEAIATGIGKDRIRDVVGLISQLYFSQYLDHARSIPLPRSLLERSEQSR